MSCVNLQSLKIEEENLTGRDVRYLRQINLNSLRILESAARLGSFTRAAEENLITASAVSQRIKTLEAQLEFRVFHRRHNSVASRQRGKSSYRMSGRPSIRS